MHIITGSKRGKKLLALEGEQVRPTTNMVKESLFNILQFDLEGRRFLDLFAGSGQIGLEALSRGAARAVFVDSSRDSVRIIRKNLEATGFGPLARVAAASFDSFLRGEREVFDIAFIDPPYQAGLMAQALTLAAERMAPGGVMVAEHGSRETLPETAGAFRKQRAYRYGKTTLTVYRRDENGEEEREC